MRGKEKENWEIHIEESPTMRERKRKKDEKEREKDKKEIEEHGERIKRMMEE